MFQNIKRQTLKHLGNQCPRIPSMRAYVVMWRFVVGGAGDRGCSVYSAWPRFSSWVWKEILTYTNYCYQIELSKKKITGLQSLSGSRSHGQQHAPFLIVFSLWKGPGDPLSTALPCASVSVTLGLIVLPVPRRLPGQHILTGVFSQSVKV